MSEYNFVWSLEIRVSAFIMTVIIQVDDRQFKWITNHQNKDRAVIDMKMFCRWRKNAVMRKHYKKWNSS